MKIDDWLGLTGMAAEPLGGQDLVRVIFAGVCQGNQVRLASEGDGIR